MKKVINVNTGNIFPVLSNGSRESKTNFLIRVKKVREKIPARRGETNQDKTINPVFSQFTAFPPP